MAGTAYKSEKGYQKVKQAYTSVLEKWPLPCETQVLKTSFGDTNIITWGNKDGEPLLLLHGGGNCALMWGFLALELGVKYRVFAPDIIGDVGLSIPRRPFVKTLDYAEWFSELLVSLGIDEVNLAGISWGGGIALQIGLTVPQQLHRLVVMSPAWGIEIFRIWALLFRSLPSVLWPSPRRIRKLLGWLSTRRPIFSDPLGASIVKYLTVAMVYYARPKSVNPIIFSDADLMCLTVPTLLLIGEKEVIYRDPGKVINRAKKVIPNIETAIIPDAGHALFYDQPEITGRRIIDFLCSSPA